MRRDGQVLEVGQVPPALAPFHPAKFFLRFRMCRNVIRVDRLVVQCLGERQQHLRQFALGLKMIRTRTVVLLLVASQLHLQTQNFDVQIVGKALLFLCPSRLLFGSLLLFFGSLPLRSRSPSSAATMAFNASLSSGKLDSAAGTTKLCHNFLRITYPATFSLLLSVVRS